MEIKELLELRVIPTSPLPRHMISWSMNPSIAEELDMDLTAMIDDLFYTLHINDIQVELPVTTSTRYVDLLPGRNQIHLDMNLRGEVVKTITTSNRVVVDVPTEPKIRSKWPDVIRAGTRTIAHPAVFGQADEVTDDQFATLTEVSPIPVLFPAAGATAHTFVEVEFDLTDILSEMNLEDELTIKGSWTQSGAGQSYRIYLENISGFETIDSNNLFSLQPSLNTSDGIFRFQLNPATANTALLLNHVVMEYNSYAQAFELKLACDSERSELSEEEVE